MNKRLKTIGIFALVIAVAIIVVLLPKQKEASPAEEAALSVAPSVADTPEVALSESGETDEERARRRAAAQEKLLEEASQNIVKLQSLLDDNERHDEALELALKMSQGNRAERAASLDTFLWVGGPKSVKALLALRHDTGEIRERANEVMNHLIQQNLHEDKGELLTADDWFSLLDGNPDSDEANSYLTLLAAFDVATAAPVLIRLLESENETNRERAKEYLEFISNGESLTTVEEARKWYETYRKEHQAEGADTAGVERETAESVAAP